MESPNITSKGYTFLFIKSCPTRILIRVRPWVLYWCPFDSPIFHNSSLPWSDIEMYMTLLGILFQSFVYEDANKFIQLGKIICILSIRCINEPSMACTEKDKCNSLSISEWIRKTANFKEWFIRNQWNKPPKCLECRNVWRRFFLDSTLDRQTDR